MRSARSAWRQRPRGSWGEKEGPAPEAQSRQRATDELGQKIQGEKQTKVRPGAAHP